MADKTVTVTCSEVGIVSLPDELQVTMESTDEELAPIADDLLEAIINGRY